MSWLSFTYLINLNLERKWIKRNIILCSSNFIWNCQNSHAICDLGLSIMKRLAAKEDDSQWSTVSVSLPSMLYKLYEKKEGDGSVVTSAKNIFYFWMCTGFWMRIHLPILWHIYGSQMHFIVAPMHGLISPPWLSVNDPLLFFKLLEKWCFYVAILTCLLHYLNS